MTQQSSVKPVAPLLDERELAAWQGFLRAHAQIVRDLDQELREVHGLTLSEYEALLLLADAPDGRLRLRELAAGALLTPGGATRLCDRLFERGLIRREPSATDGRGFDAVLTERGRGRFAAARPLHLAGVRERFLGRLDDTAIGALAALWPRVLSDGRR